MVPPLIFFNTTVNCCFLLHEGELKSRMNFKWFHLSKNRKSLKQRVISLTYQDYTSIDRPQQAVNTGHNMSS